jgi:hypothetical protein
MYDFAGTRRRSCCRTSSARASGTGRCNGATGQGEQQDAGQGEGINATEGIVDDRARTQVAIIIEHRRDIREAREAFEAMLGQLRSETFNGDKITAGIAELREAAGLSKTGRLVLSVLDEALALGNRATILQKLVASLHQIVALERQALAYPASTARRPAIRS